LDSLKLVVPRADLIRALRVLGTNRRRRFSGVVRIWLAYEGDSSERRLREERGGMTAGLLS
jgi:hypothetical protein